MYSCGPLFLFDSLARPGPSLYRFIARDQPVLLYRYAGVLASTAADRKV